MTLPAFAWSQGLGAGLLALGLVVVPLTVPRARGVEVADPLAPVTV